MVIEDESNKTVGGEKVPPKTTPATSEKGTDDDIYDEATDRPEPKSNQTLERLYHVKKPDQPARKELPKLDDRDYLMLKEHVRLLNGKPPMVKRPQKIVCWMDDPEIAPRHNLTSIVRTKRIQENLDDRKDSEEDPFSARCTY